MTQHEIKTINDIYRVVTPENTEAFLADFTAWLRYCHGLEAGRPEHTSRCGEVHVD